MQLKGFCADHSAVIENPTLDRTGGCQRGIVVDRGASLMSFLTITIRQVRDVCETTTQIGKDDKSDGMVD